MFGVLSIFSLFLGLTVAFLMCRKVEKKQLLWMAPALLFVLADTWMFRGIGLLIRVVSLVFCLVFFQKQQKDIKKTVFLGALLTWSCDLLWFFNDDGLASIISSLLLLAAVWMLFRKEQKIALLMSFWPLQQLILTLVFFFVPYSAWWSVVCSILSASAFFFGAAYLAQKQKKKRTVAVIGISAVLWILMRIWNFYAFVLNISISESAYVFYRCTLIAWFFIGLPLLMIALLPLVRDYSCTETEVSECTNTSFVMGEGSGCKATASQSATSQKKAKYDVIYIK